jgi:SSS family transporter
MEFGLLNTVILIAYMLAMVVIGVFFSGKQKTTEDYFLASRSLPWLPVAMSMYASVTSASTYLVLPAKAYSENVSLLVASIVSPLVAPLLIFVIYPVYRRMRVTTSYEYIGARFGLAARQAVAVLFVLARLGWLGTVLYAPSLAMHVTTGWSLAACILTLGVVATVYTVMGGLSAVVWTDVVQFLILVVGAFWVLGTLLCTVPGGAPAIWQAAAEAGRLKVFDLHLNAGSGSISGVFLHMSIWSVSLHMVLNMCHEYGTDQVTVQRLMAVREDRGVTKAILFNAATDFVLTAVLLAIGLGLWAFYRQDAAGLPALPSADGILPYYIRHNLPAGIAGLVITAILAAAMSSVDSGLNSIATVLDSDLLGVWRKRHGSEGGEIRVARGMTVVLGAIATGIAFVMADIGGILDGLSSVMSLFSAPVLVLFLLGMLWRRTAFVAWLGALVVSLPTVWYVNNRTPVDWSWRFPLAFVLTLVLTVVLTFVLPRARRPATP